MKIDPQEVLENHPLFQLLSKYAWKASKHELRNKTWLTGGGYHDVDGNWVEGSDEIRIHFLFESEFRGQTFNADDELIPIQGIIVKHNFVLDTSKPFRTQIVKEFEKHFDQVMKSHFTNE